MGAVVFIIKISSYWLSSININMILILFKGMNMSLIAFIFARVNTNTVVLGHNWEVEHVMVLLIVFIGSQ